MLTEHNEGIYKAGSLTLAELRTRLTSHSFARLRKVGEPSRIGSSRIVLLEMDSDEVSARHRKLRSSQVKVLGRKEFLHVVREHFTT